MSRDDQLITSGDVGGIVGLKTTHLYSPKVDFGIDRHDEGFKPSQNHLTECPMVLFLSSDYPVDASVGFLWCCVWIW